MFSSFASRCACATLIVATLFAGCTDELKYRKGDPANGTIGFTARLLSGWANTRAEQCDRPYVSEVSGGEAIADSLFLNMTTTPGVMTGTYDLHHAEGLEYDTDRKGEGIVTRATPVTPDNGEMYTDFGVSAYSYQGDWDEATATPNYFYNIKASKSGDGKYTLPASYFWPGPNYKMRFFAIAPYNNPYYVVSGEEQTGSPKITVDVPGNVGNQKDLLVATSGELDGNARKDVDLQFMHPLTAVRFVVGDDMTSGTINKINIHNVYCQGDLNLSNKEWTLGTQKRTFYQTLGQTVANQGDGNAKPGTDIGTASQTFMMMPQTLPEDAMISMEIKVGTTTYTVSAPIAGQVWQPGTTVTYQLSTTSINWTYTFTASVANNIDENTRTGGIKIDSYRTHITGIKKAIPYTATYSLDNGNSFSEDFPEYIFIEPFRNSVTSETYSITIADADLIKLRKNPIVGESQPYNLSNSKGAEEIENTANCYVIKAAGHYRLPLVYGNAIKNGQPNPASYKAKNPGATNVLETFINHNGNAITDPFIYNNTNCVPTSCRIEWQTNKNVIKNCKLDNNKQFIEFEIDADKIEPGNAIISVRTSAQTMWSWHIWITSMDTESTTMINGSNPQYKHSLMNLRLGQTGYNGNLHFSVNNGTKLELKIKLNNGIEDKILTLVANCSQFAPPSAPLYQFGRKDPLVIKKKYINQVSIYYPSAYNSLNTPCQTYNLIAPSSFGSTPTNVIMRMIQQPTYTPYGVTNYMYNNLWDNLQDKVGSATENKTNRTKTGIKTIYDPSPIGFNVTSESAFGAFVGKPIDITKDSYGFYVTTDDGSKFWFLETGMLCYNWTFGSFDGGYSCNCITNRPTGMSGELEFTGTRYSGNGATCYFYSRASYGHVVYCEREMD